MRGSGAGLLEIFAVQGPPADRPLLLSGAAEPPGPAALPRITFQGAPSDPGPGLRPSRGHLRPPRQDHAPRRSPEAGRPRRDRARDRLSLGKDPAIEGGCWVGDAAEGQDSRRHVSTPADTGRRSNTRDYLENRMKWVGDRAAGSPA